MRCPDCGSELIAFAVPEPLREYAPGGGPAAAICPVCLRTHAADEGEAAAGSDFSAVAPSFPGGEGGVAFALLLGELDSLALSRPAIEALCERAERTGTDVLLALDRLAAEESVDPHFDIDRRRPQLAQLLG